jgi:hypothetical protein
MGTIHRSPFRCRNCQNRFYVYIAPELHDAEAPGEVRTESAAAPKAEPAENPDIR